MTHIIYFLDVPDFTTKPKLHLDIPANLEAREDPGSHSSLPSSDIQDFL